MDVVRWRLQDMLTNEVHTVELNPNQMGGYLFPKSYDFAVYGGGRMRGVRAPSTPVEWTFGGVVRTESHHDSLITWERKPGKVRVYDHLGRTFEVMIRSLDMRDRRPSSGSTWRFEYTFNCLLLRRIT
jgi:hypothetical protein